jgi:ribose 5-phosphate isomerase A
VPELVDIEAEKRLAAEAAAELIADGMSVGLGTGSTVAYLVPAIAQRGVTARFVATSPQTEAAARAAGLEVEPFDRLDHLDIAVDGADEVAADGWLVKGRGGAHTREKIVAAAARRFVVIVDSTKPVERLGGPIPLELHAFGIRATLREVGQVRLRDTRAAPDGGVLADYEGDVGDPAAVAARLDAVPGVVAHGLFAPAMVSEVFVGRGGEVERRAI